MGKKRILKGLDLELVRRSDAGEITCRDGEVDSYSNLPWLDEVPDEGKTGNSGNGSSKRASSSRIVLSFGDSIGDLPSGSIPILRHLTSSNPSREHLLFFYSNNAIGFRDCATNQSVATGVSWRYSSYGNFRQAVANGNLVLLLGDKKMVFMLYHPLEIRYTLHETLPDFPRFSVQSSPAVLSPWHLVETSDTSALEVKVDLTKYDYLSVGTFENWFGQVAGTSMFSVVEHEVFRSIGEGIADYAAKVEASGLSLQPLWVRMGMGRQLMTAEQSDFSHSIGKLQAFLDGWTFHAGVLTLSLSLTLVPLQTTVNYHITDEMKSWNEWLPSLDLYTAPAEMPWRVDSRNGVEVLHFGTLTDSSGKRAGVGFLLGAKDASGRQKAPKESAYRVARRFPATRVLNGLVAVGYDFLGSKLPEDYRIERSEPLPDRLISTSSGVVLAGGGVVFRDENGGFREEGVSSSIVYADLDCEASFQNALSLGNARVISGIESFAAKGSTAGRPPLNIFSGDGIRLVTSYANGQYHISRKISTEILRGPELAVATDTGVALLSDAGLRLISGVATMKTLALEAEEATEGEMPADLGAGQLIYDRWTSALTVVTCGNPWVWDCREGRGEWVADMALPRLVDMGEEWVSANPAGDLRLLAYERVRIEESEDSSVDTGEMGGFRPSGYCGYQTRALKFGSPYVRKTLREVEVAPDVELIVESSDDMKRWQQMVRGVSPLRGLHLPWRRYWRVSTSAPLEGAGWLRVLHLGVIGDK